MCLFTSIVYLKPFRKVLCSLQSPETRLHTRRHTSRRRLTNRGTQTDPDESVRFAREDTEQLSGLMKAAFKQVCTLH